MRARLIAAVGGVVLASCNGASNAALTFPIAFVVESDPGVGLRGARVFVDGNSIGETDSNGLLQTKVYRRSGLQVTVEHDCPDGHEAPVRPKVLRLREFEGVDPSGPLTMEVSLRCRPEKRLVVFVVRAKKGPYVPVLLNGESVARTNGSGVAHFSVWAAPGTDYLVELDTRERARIIPQSPTHLFTAPDADEIFVVNQSFELAKRSRRPDHWRNRITKIE